MNIKIIYENQVILCSISKDITVKDLIKNLKSSHIVNIGNQEIKLLDQHQILMENSDIIKFIPIENKKNELKINFSINNEIPFLNEKILFLQTFKKINTNKYSNTEDFFNNKNKIKNNLETMQDLIMKTTNAKQKMKTRNIIDSNYTNIPDRLKIFENFLGSNLGNFMQPGIDHQISSVSNRLNSHTTEINNLLSMIMPMVGGDSEVPSLNVGRNFYQNNSNPHFGRINRRIQRDIINPPIIPNQNLVDNLKEMGFPEEQCRRALVVANNDISRATDLLLSDGLDLIPQENIQQEQTQNNVLDNSMYNILSTQNINDFHQNVVDVNINSTNNLNNLNNQNIHTNNLPNINYNNIQNNINPLFNHNNIVDSSNSSVDLNQNLNNSNNNLNINNHNNSDL